MKVKFGLLSVVLVVAALGCGGGGGGGGGTPTATPSVSVQWPARTRTLAGPTSALSVQITLTGSGSPVTIDGDRSSSLTAHTDTYTGTSAVPTGNYNLAATFYSAAAEGGAVVATATAAVALAAGGTLTNQDGSPIGTISFTGVVKTVLIPSDQMVTLGQTQQLNATAEDSGSNVIALTPGSFSWAVTQGTAITVTPDGIATGVSSGTASVVATVDGVSSAAATVTVPVPAGALPPNVIFYSLLLPSSTEVHYINPNGTGDTVFQTFPLNVDGFAANPAATSAAVPNQLVFSWSAGTGSNFGIYSNSTPSLTGATTILDPSVGFYDILSMKVSNDGQWIYFIAEPTAGSQQTLYRLPIAGGTPTLIDSAYYFDLDQAGDMLVYDKLNGGNADLYTVSSSGGTPTDILNTPNDDKETPQWSKDGTTIVFSDSNQSVNSGFYQIESIPAAGGTPTVVATSTTLDLYGASYSGDGTMVSYVGYPQTVTAAQLFTTVIATGVTNALLNNGNLDVTTYWTTSSGRARGGLQYFLSRHKRPPHRR